MNKAKDMLDTIIQKPISRIKARSAKAYDRYNELFRSIKKLARPLGKEERKQ